MSADADAVSQAAAALDKRLGDPAVFRPPEQWTLTGSWRRAQTERDLGGPTDPSHRQVFLEESARPHRVLFAIYEGELRAECDLDGACPGFRYDGWCAHVATCWWRWVTGEIAVTDLDTGRHHTHPPSWLSIRGGSP